MNCKYLNVGQRICDNAEESGRPWLVMISWILFSLLTHPQIIRVWEWNTKTFSAFNEKPFHLIFGGFQVFFFSSLHSSFAQFGIEKSSRLWTMITIVRKKKIGSKQRRITLMMRSAYKHFLKSISVFTATQKTYIWHPTSLNELLLFEWKKKSSSDLV